MKRRLDLDLLLTFVAVADEAGFARAAARVHRSPPAISMRIGKLEATLGAAVFERDTRNLKLTGAGETLLVYARRILDLHDEALDALRAQRLEGSVRIGAPDDYVGALLPKPLKRFAAAFPKVRIEVVCEQSTTLIPRTKAGEIDLAFVTRTPGMDGTFVRREPMVWVAAPTSSIWLERPLPVALYEPGSVARKNALRALAKAGIRHRAAYASPSLLGLVSVVEAGLAVAALAACALPPGVIVLDHRHGLPDIAPLDIVAIRGAGPRTPESDALARDILENLAAAPVARPHGLR